jgi:hypothetical protein
MGGEGKGGEGREEEEDYIMVHNNWKEPTYLELICQNKIM